MPDDTDERSRTLDPVARSRVVAILEAHAPEYAATVAIQLDSGNAVSRAVSDLADTIRQEQAASRIHISSELRQMRTQVLGVVVLAMMINAAMVGVGVSWGVGQQQITVTPAGHARVPLPNVSPFPEPDVMVPLWAPESDTDPAVAGPDGGGGDDAEPNRTEL